MVEVRILQKNTATEPKSLGKYGRDLLKDHLDDNFAPGQTDKKSL